MQYQQISFEQRYSIDCMLKRGLSKSEIAQAIGVNASTIYRELKRETFALKWVNH